MDAQSEGKTASVALSREQYECSRAPSPTGGDAATIKTMQRLARCVLFATYLTHLVARSSAREF